MTIIEKDKITGKEVVFKHSGPFFGFGGRKPEHLGDGKNYDLLGFSVWISHTDDLLLKGRVVTVRKIKPQYQRLFTIRNPPAGFPNSVYRKNRCRCCSSGTKYANSAKNDRV